MVVKNINAFSRKKGLIRFGYAFTDDVKEVAFFTKASKGSISDRLMGEYANANGLVDLWSDPDIMTMKCVFTRRAVLLAE